MEAIAALPWWAGVALAAVFYLVLHNVASQPAPEVVQPGQVGATVAKSVWRVLASVFQYIVPLMCLVGAGVSALQRRKRKALLSHAARSPAADVLDGLSWQQFERLVGEAFRLQGYTVVETGGGGADGGVDLVLSKAGEKFLVQCKRWKAFMVGVDVVRELYGVMAARGSTGGFVVTSGRFSAEAVSFASGTNVTLIDGPKLIELLRRVDRDSALHRTPPPARHAEPARSAQDDRNADPRCPVCAKAMVRRLARRGAGAGREFWGCTGYPACKGTRPLD